MAESKAKSTRVKAKKAASRKVAAKKAVVKNAVAKKAVVKKATVKKAAVKKATVKKAAVKKATVKKAVVKKAAVKKVTVKKAAVKKAAVKKAAVKKAAVKKAAVKKAAVKKAAVKKATVKKATVKKATVKKATVKKAAAKKAAVKKKALKKTAPRKPVAGKGGTERPAVKKAASAKLFAQLVAGLSAIPSSALEALSSGKELSKKAAAELQSSFDSLQSVTRAMQMLVGGSDDSREGLNGPDPALMDAQAPLWNALMDYYFRLEIDGWERLPDEPALLIGIHSGGPLTMDAWTVAMAWWRHFREERTLHGTAHDVLMNSPGLGTYFRRLGVISPSKESIAAAFRKGDDVILWPGGVEDSYRRFDKRDKAVLAGRKGFVRLAIREQVPIMPMATVGGHETLVVLSEGRGLAKMLGLKERMRTELAPITLSVPFGITLHLTPFQHVPLPAKIRTRFLEPIHLDADPDKENDRQYVDQVYREVESVIQAGMNELAKKRKFPIWG